MTTQRDLDRLLAAHLADGMEVLSDRVVDAVLDEVHRTRQRAVLGPWRTPVMNNMLKVAFAAAAGVAVVVVGIGVALLPRSNPSDGSGLGAPPTASPVSSPTTSPSPTLAPISLTGQIAFERTVDGNTDIYLMNLDRTGLVRLTDDPAVDRAPSWSADGTRIVFTRGSADGRDVYVMDADGGNVTRLTTSTEGEDSATFSPDGSEIVFLRYVDPAYFDLFVMDSDGSSERLLWHKDGVFANGPRWSNDHGSVLFNEDDTGGGGIDIVRLDLATQTLTRITDTPGDDSTFDVSPDGGTIAFQSDRSPGGIFLMEVDGSNVRHLIGSWTKGYPLSWGADGRHVVYWQVDGWLYIVPVTGGDPIKWTEGAGTVAWRPAP